MKYFAFLTIICVVLVSCRGPVPAGTKIYSNEAYGTHSRNKLDIFLPKDRDINTKVVIQIHGGAWVFGDKSNNGMKDMRYQLLEEGYAVASMNYRYACGDYTKQMDDVKMAIEHIALQSGNWDIGSDKFGLMGYSAGGHLALLYAHAFDNDDVVKAVVSIVGPTDMTDPLFHQYAENNGLLWTAEALFGATFEEDSALYAEGSPIFYHRSVPSHFMYGQLDNLVPYQQGVRMFDSLRSYGVMADTTIFTNAGHNLDGEGKVNTDQMVAETVSWFNQYLN